MVFSYLDWVASDPELARLLGVVFPCGGPCCMQKEWERCFAGIAD
jgi:hypothetical protein